MPLNLTLNANEFTQINSLEQYLQWIDVLSKNVEDLNKHRSFDEQYELYFRGVEDCQYADIPSIFRNAGYIRNEDRIFNECISKNPQDFADEKSTFEKLVKMQHYDVPTRLLDVSKNPLVALYFASRSIQVSKGKVTAYIINRKKMLYSDDILTTIIANLARQRRDELCFELQKNFDSLCSISKQDPNFFESPIILSDIQKVYFVHPPMNNPRIIRQDGAFLLFGSLASEICPEIMNFDLVKNLQLYFDIVGGLVYGASYEILTQKISEKDINEFFSLFSDCKDIWNKLWQQLLQYNDLSRKEDNVREIAHIFRKRT